MSVEPGHSSLTRRERFERIVGAERDRRAGRIDVAIAALGDALEWPARVVLALAKLPVSEASETRRVLEEGLDAWMAEIGLSWLDESDEISSVDLDRPIDDTELERAFADAEVQTDEMHDVNEVAARVLMQDSMDLAELGGDTLVPVDASMSIQTDAAIVDDLVGEDSVPPESSESDPQALAVLERWLQNLEGSGAGRAR